MRFIKCREVGATFSTYVAVSQISEVMVKEGRPSTIVTVAGRHLTAMSEGEVRQLLVGEAEDPAADAAVSEALGGVLGAKARWI